MKMSERPDVFREGKTVLFRYGDHDDAVIGVFTSNEVAEYMTDLLNGAAKDDPETFREVFGD
jgi:hypothetical protein